VKAGAAPPGARRSRAKPKIKGGRKMETGKMCSFDGQNCNGCGKRKNNWYTCQWGSIDAEYFIEMERKGTLPDKFTHPGK
jgi:hypothetical protein